MNHFSGVNTFKLVAVVLNVFLYSKIPGRDSSVRFLFVSFHHISEGDLESNIFWSGTTYRWDKDKFVPTSAYVICTLMILLHVSCSLRWLKRVGHVWFVEVVRLTIFQSHCNEDGQTDPGRFMAKNFMVWRFVAGHFPDWTFPWVTTNYRNIFCDRLLY